MTISPTGLISWAAPLGTSVPTAYDVTVSGSDGSTTVAQTFNVRVNHTPTIAPTGPIAVAHGSVTIAAPGVLAGATDPDGDALSSVQTVAASAGTLSLSANGSYTWTGPQPASGSTPVTFSVASRDPFGLQSAPTTVTLDVAANVAPVAANDAYTITLARGGILNAAARHRQRGADHRHDTSRSIRRSLRQRHRSGQRSACEPANPSTSLRAASDASIRIDRRHHRDPDHCWASRRSDEATVMINANGTFRFTPRIPNTNNTALQFPVAGTYEFAYIVRDDQNAAVEPVGGSRHRQLIASHADAKRGLGPVS